MSKKTNASSKGLPVKTHRWQWMAGAAAASLATVSSAQAAEVTVNLTGNYISATGGDHLNADLTGDSVPSFTINQPFYQYLNFGASIHAQVRFWINSYHNLMAASADRGFFGNGSQAAMASYTPLGTIVQISSSPLTAPIPITFNDPLINGGAATPAELEVTVTPTLGDVEIQLDSYSYNQISASAPDQTSTLALLALGAGGVLAFRQRRQAT